MMRSGQGEDEWMRGPMVRTGSDMVYGKSGDHRRHVVPVIPSVRALVRPYHQLQPVLAQKPLQAHPHPLLALLFPKSNVNGHNHNRSCKEQMHC